jgi:hypothetical protein
MKKKELHGNKLKNGLSSGILRDDEYIDSSGSQRP